MWIPKRFQILGRLVSAGLVAATALSWSRPVFADAPAARKAAAESAFQRGVDLVAMGLVSEGCRQLEASQELDAALGTMLHLADCYEREGRTGSAWAMFHEARSVAERTGQRERQRLAMERAAALEATLSYIVIDVAPTEGLVVMLNGAVMPEASWGTPLPVDPGTQRVEALALGHGTFYGEVSIPDGPSTVSFKVPALKRGTTPVVAPGTSAAGVRRAASSLALAEPAEQPSQGAQRLAGYAAVGIGAGGVIAGGVLGLLAMQKNEDSLEHCSSDDPNACSSEGVRLRETARDLAGSATLAAILGGAVAAAGVVLVLTAPDGSSSQEVVLSASANAGTAAVALRGRF